LVGEFWKLKGFLEDLMGGEKRSSKKGGMVKVLAYVEEF